MGDTQTFEICDKDKKTTNGNFNLVQMNWVFQTSVSYREDVKGLSSFLNSHTSKFSGGVTKGKKQPWNQKLGEV